MRKIFCFFAVLITCLMLANVASAEEVTATVPTYCQACKQDVTDWQVAPESWSDLAGGHHHFYLSKNVSYYWLTPKKDADATTVCLDLNGYRNSKGGRILGVHNGHTVNVMDSSADQVGYLEGKKGTNNPTGGAIFNQGTLSLYSGTLKFNSAGATDHVTYSGGVIAQYSYSSAVFNMYGGRVEGGQLITNGSSSRGAAIYATSGKINLYGGDITYGKTGGGNLSCIYLNKATDIAAPAVTLSGDVNVDEIKTNSSYAYVNVSGTYSGRTRFAYASGFTLNAGKKVGNATDTPNITGELFCTNGWLIKIVDSALQLATFTPSGEWHYCDHCKEVRRWTKLTSSNPQTPYNTAGEYHYYVSATTSISKQVRAGTGSSLCLDLYGNTLTSTGRGLLGSGSSTINLMDTKGSGVLHAKGGTNNGQGLAAWVTSAATINMYSGTVRYTNSDEKDSRYGTVAVAGVLNMYGGTIEGANLAELHSGSHAGAIQVFDSGKLNLYGGTVTSGQVGKYAPCVEVSASTTSVKLAGSANVENIYFASNYKNLTVSGDYTGNASVTFKTVPALGAEVGVATDDAKISGSLTCTNKDWLIRVEGTKLITAIDAPVIIVDGETETGYDTLQDALNTCESGYVKLLNTLEEDVTVSENITLDLNGNAITGTVTVADGATLYGMDSQTDDYTVADEIYGQLTVVGNVQGAPDYLPITQDGKVSFHKYAVKITDMTLRSEKAGIYYKSSFLGDEVIAGIVESFGVALNVKEIPDETNMDTTCRYSTFTTFESGAAGNASTSTLLKNILQTTNANDKNKYNLGVKVYGRPYLKTADGYIFGQAHGRNLAEQLQGVDEQFTDLTVEQHYAVMNLYETYHTVLENLTLPNMAQQKTTDEKTLSLLMVGNSFCYYYVEELYGLLMANPDPNRGYEKVEIVNVYYSGCSLTKHYNWWIAGASNYQVFRTNENGRKELTPATGTKWSLEDSLMQGNWDYISLQGASSENNYSGATTEENVAKMIPLATPLLGRFHELFPDAQLLWHRTWPFEIGRVSGSTTYTEELLAKYNTGMQNVCDWMCEEFDKDKDYDLKMVNSGAAWVIAREENAKLETSLIPVEGGLCARKGKRNEDTYPYYTNNANAGDGYHDGDIGGGQFLNACVWYETITGQSVLDNTYAPSTSNLAGYTLSDDFVVLLRNAAHAVNFPE